MKISQFKKHLNTVSELNMIQPNGIFIPKHFHITEAGLTTKHFIDCGGTVRTEKTISFQVWIANDTDHRLVPEKLTRIINLSEPLFNGEDLEVEIEYQTDTISKYGLDFVGSNFVLTNKFTNCLAKDTCGIPSEGEKIVLSELKSSMTTSCKPGGGCC
ncbi:DUF6428 family protein [Cytophaga aurantiaca]|uniref:DUF6428 family protein n=1 Tax=Cytophaga aurantiaca TaxID=29530 RepID=UPI00037BA067|nr:DUF6428 family protein [Cytophaga aurantiaca]